MLKPAQNQFLWDLIRVADPRLTASHSQLGFFFFFLLSYTRNLCSNKLGQMENHFRLVHSKHYISH